MKVGKWSRKNLATMWVVGATLTGGVLLVLYLWPRGEDVWLAIAIAALLPIYHVWKVRNTLEWLQEEYGFRFGDSGGEDFYRAEDSS